MSSFTYHPSGVAADKTVTLDTATLYSGNRGDTVNFGAGVSSVLVRGNGGNDTITGGLKESTVYGDDGDDYINLTGTINIVFGGEGNDKITASGAIDAGEGNDYICGAGNITPGTGDDIVYTDGCHAHNNIFYYSGDGNDIFQTHSDNDTIILSGPSLVNVSTVNGMTFNLNTGNTIKILDAAKKYKFIHLNAGGTTKTYLNNGSSIVNVVNNFSAGKTVTDPKGINFIYNGGKSAVVDAGAGNDVVYNSDYAPFATIIGGAGNDTVSDHSAAAFVKYSSGEGNDSVEFHDTVQVTGYTPSFDDTTEINGLTGRDNVTHYYGGGLLVIDGIVSSDPYNASGATFNVSGGGSVKVNSNVFTVREYGVDSDEALTSDGLKYYRYWNGRKFRSFVYRDDERTTGATVDGSVAKGRGNYDNSSFSEVYQNTTSPVFTTGDDYIYTNFGTNKVLDAKSGDDYIHNWGATKSTVKGGDGNDTILNDHTKYTAHVTIDAGADDDYVYNNSHHVSINGGTGADLIYNMSENIFTYDYGYTETLNGSYVTIDGGEGDDYIHSEGAYNTIGGGDGNDTIHNLSAYGPASIDGGTGNDYIENYSSKSTITGGDGSDTILNYSYTGPASIDGGTERNYIFNRSSQSTITADADNDTIYNMTGNGPTSINAGDGNNFIYNQASSETILGDNDETLHTRTTILSGDGSDTIYNFTSTTWPATIPAGRATINSGDGNDKIFNNAWHTTITGGKGDDSIVDGSANSMIEYTPGDGSDTIVFATTTDYGYANNLIHYYGGGLLAINSDSVYHSFNINNGYKNINELINVSPQNYTVQGNSNYAVNSVTYKLTGSYDIDVDGQKLTVKVGDSPSVSLSKGGPRFNNSAFTIREGTDTNNYKYTRYWANNWNGNGIEVRKFNSYIFLDDVHNLDDNPNLGGTYDDPRSANKYKDNMSFTDEDDYIYTGFGSGKVIDALGGNDFLVNFGATRSTFLGGAGDDYIYNLDRGSDLHKQTCLTGDDSITSYVTIDGGEGRDFLYNESTNVSVAGGADNDSVLNYGATVTIDGGDNDDSVNNKGRYSFVVGGDGSDSIFNSGDFVTIDGDRASDTSVGGADYISNTGEYSSIIGGVGDDTIYSTGNRVTIDGGVGADTIYNSGSDSSIIGGEGNDTIDSRGARATIFGGEDDDNVYNHSWLGAAYINVRAADDSLRDGDNYVENNSTKSTIIAGSGNDTIYNNSTLTTGIHIGDTTIDAGDGNNYVDNKAVHSTIFAGTGNDTVYNRSNGGPALISIKGGDNFVDNRSHQSTIKTGDGDDIIYNRSAKGKAFIDAGNGYNYVENYSDSVKIVSGDDADTIFNYSSNGPIEISSGGGEDFIYVAKGDRLTVKPGKGNDIVTLDATNYNNHYVFDTDDGKDTVYGWREVNLDDLTIGSGLRLGAGYSTYAVGKNGQDLLVRLWDNHGSIRFVDVLEPKPPYDALIAVTIDNKTELNAKVHPTDQKETYYDMENATSIFGATGDLATLIHDGPDKGSLIVKREFNGVNDQVTIVSDDYGVTLNDGKTNPTVDNFNELAEYGIVTVGAGIGTLAGSNMRSIGVTLIDKIKGIKLKESVRSEILEEDILTVTRTNKITIKGNAADNYIIGGKGNDSITGESGNDTLEGGAGNDTLVGHLQLKETVTGEVFDDAFSDDTNTFVVRAYPREGAYKKSSQINHTTIADYQECDAIKIAAGYISEGKISTKNVPWVNFTVINSNTNLNKATIKVLEGVNKKITVINEDGTFSRQIYGESKISVGNDDGQTINTLWNDTVITIDGSARTTAVGLIGNNKQSNYIISGNGNNIITTGKGKDTVIYTGGNDTITDYDLDKDVIKLPEDCTIESVTDTSDGKKQEWLYTFKNGGSLLVRSKSASKKSNGVTFINANEKEDDITGNDKDNVIKGSAKNDTIRGGAGNDTLTGGKGADVFIYTKGKDVITDYAAGDRIILSDGQSITGTSLKGKKGSDVLLTVGTESNPSIGSILVQKGNGKDITLFDTLTGAETTCIYGDGIATLKPSTDSQIIEMPDGFVTAVDASKLKTDLDITGNDKDNVIKGSAKNDTIRGGAGKDVLNGGAGNDVLDGGEDDDSLNGGMGNDTLNGGSGNDTLTGGAGADVFIYESGDVFITDYTLLGAKQAGDRIILSDGQSITGSSQKGKKGSDVLLTVGTESNPSIGSILVQKGKGKDITLFDTLTGAETTCIYGDGIATLKPSTDSQIIEMPDGFVTAVDASKLKTDLDITGNDKDNVIKGSAKNDTIRGGAGNDTLTGGKGADVFIYTKGKDVITDYAAGDIIMLSKGQTYSITSSAKNKHMVLTINDESGTAVGTLQINNRKTLPTIMTDDSTKEYNMSSCLASEPEEMWFASDDVLTTDSTDELASIMKEAPLTDLGSIDQLMTYDVSKILAGSARSDRKK